MKLLFTFLVPIPLLIPQLTFAQNYLVGIPGVEQGAGGSFDAYIQAVYVLFISIAALLAVVKIIIAGLKYMFTDIVTQKGEAKKDIQGALLGLLLVLSAVLILTVINPELTRFNLDVNEIENQYDPRADQLTSEEGNALLQYCEENDNNCDMRGCDALDDYVLEMTAGYAVAGGATGLYAGSFFGPASLATVPIFTVVGTIGGAYTGYRINQLATAGECAAVCTWLNGEIQTLNSGDSCYFPLDSRAFRQAELEATRQALREEYDCLDGRLIILGDGSVNCIRDLNDQETNLILSALEVDPTSSIAETILSRIENSQIQNIIVSDDSIINQLTQSIGADRTLLAITLPPASGSNATELTNISTQFENICSDAGFQPQYVEIGNTRYAACVE